MAATQLINSGSSREVPADIQAERAVLGSLLIDRDAIACVPFLAEADFFIEQHRLIYQAMQQLLADRAPSDFVTLCHELHQAGKLEAVGGAAYLVGLTADTPTAAHVVYYARIVAQLAARRRLIVAGGQIAALGYQEAQSTALLLREAQAELDQVGGGGESIWKSASTLLEGLFDWLDRPNAQIGIATGFAGLDRLLRGMRRGEVYIVAARPGVGKSALALQLAYNVVMAGGAVGFVSLEMSAEQMMIRLLAQHSGIFVHDIESGDALGDVRLSEAFGVLAELPLYVAEKSEITATALRRHTTQLLAQAGRLDLLVVDYIQIMDPDGKRKSLTEEVTEISRGIKRLAKELDIPVLAVAQLNRATETRADHKPTLGDLRQSGQLEQDAAAVLLMYRDELYNPATEERGIVRLNLAKHRHGATGEVKLRFDAQTMWFASIEEGN